MKLKITFFGMIAFVPNNSLPNPTSMRAVLVDARDPAEGPPGAQVHLPVILFKKDGSDKRETLDREEISIQNVDDSSAQLKLRAMPKPTSSKPSATDLSRTTVWWISQMSRIHRDAATIAQDVLVPGADGVNSRVVARVKIPSGKVKVSDLASYKGDFFPWTFEPTPAKHPLYEQALGIRVLWEVPIVGDEAKLRLTKLAPDNGFRDISIPETSSGVVEAIVGNLSEEGMKSILSSGADSGQIIDTDIDFRWLYQLSQSPPPLSDQPVPVPEASVQGKRAAALGFASDSVISLGGGPVRCPQTFFNSDSDA